MAACLLSVLLGAAGGPGEASASAAVGAPLPAEAPASAPYGSPSVISRDDWRALGEFMMLSPDQASAWSGRLDRLEAIWESDEAERTAEIGRLVVEATATARGISPFGPEGFEALMRVVDRHAARLRRETAEAIDDFGTVLDDEQLPAWEVARALVEIETLRRSVFWTIGTAGLQNVGLRMVRAGLEHPGISTTELRAGLVERFGDRPGRHARRLETVVRRSSPALVAYQQWLATVSPGVDPGPASREARRIKEQRQWALAQACAEAGTAVGRWLDDLLASSEGAWRSLTIAVVEDFCARSYREEARFMPSWAELRAAVAVSGTPGGVEDRLRRMVRDAEDGTWRVTGEMMDARDRYRMEAGWRMAMGADEHQRWRAYRDEVQALGERRVTQAIAAVRTMLASEDVAGLRAGHPVRMACTDMLAELELGRQRLLAAVRADRWPGGQ